MCLNAGKILSCSFLLIVTFGSATAEGWRGIVPLESTRQDVERILGRAAGPDRPLYRLPDLIVSVEYARYGCDQAPKVPGWPVAPVQMNVPPGTVISIRVVPKDKVKLSSMGIDATKIKRVHGDEDLPSHFYYVNETEGLIIEVFAQPGEVVHSLIYRPQAKDAHSRCPGKASPS